MGFFGDLWDSATSIVKSAVETVKSVATTIGKAVMDNAEKLIMIVGSNMHPLAKVVTAVATILGIFKDNENVEEIGAKAMVAERKPDDFDSYNDYINYLRDEIKLDKEKFENATPETKLARMAIGSTIAIKATNEKLNQDIPFEAWVALAKAGIEDKEALVIFKNFKGSLNEFTDYVNGELTPKKELEVGDKLAQTYKEIDATLSENEIEEKIMQISNPKD